MALYINCFMTWLSCLEHNNISAENVYNWDEKGFLVGLLKTLKRTMSVEAYRSGRVRQAIHDKNRKFISLLACVSAITVKPHYKNPLDKNTSLIRICCLVPLIFCAKIRITSR
jgi:hypothetical protein